MYGYVNHGKHQPQKFDTHRLANQNKTESRKAGTDIMAKIKVIKRGTEIKAAPASEQSIVRAAAATKRAAAQEMVQNVNSWVSDWRQRKQAETVAAYRQLLGDKAQFASR